MTSKFKGIFDAARGQPAVDVDEAPALQAAPAAASAPTQPSERRRGRPPGGKRNDPDYEQVTAYIRKDIHRRAKIALLKEDRKIEFSELVDQLLADWLQTRE